jgi:hypothetical protein
VATLEKKGSLDRWKKMRGFPRETPIRTHWPKDLADFEKKYPVLYRAFWNQRRVNANTTPPEERPRKTRTGASTLWEVIDSTLRIGADKAAQVKKIKKVLDTFELNDLVSFQKQMNRELAKANTFHFMVAAFLVYGYISDDFFLEFRAWVMLCGSHAFAAAVKNPDTIVRLISRSELDRFSCAGFPELPFKAWLERDEDSDMSFSKAGHLKDKDVVMPWPQSKSEFEERYPVLFKAFWNQRRIEMFHRH